MLFPALRMKFNSTSHWQLHTFFLIVNWIFFRLRHNSRSRGCVKPDPLCVIVLNIVQPPPQAAALEKQADDGVRTLEGKGEMIGEYFSMQISGGISSPHAIAFSKTHFAGLLLLDFPGNASLGLYL